MEKYRSLKRDRLTRNYPSIEMTSEWHQNGSLIASLSLREYEGKTHNKGVKLAISTDEFATEGDLT